MSQSISSAYEDRALASHNYDLVDSSLAADELLQGERLLRRVWIVAGVTVGVIFGWATFAPLSRGVVATGAIATESARQVIQNLDGGIIQRLFVKEGDKVVAGQPLAELDATLANAEYQVVRQQYFSHLAERAVLEADIGGGAPVWPQELQQAALEDAKIKAVVDAQLRILRSRRAGRYSSKAILADQIASLNSQIIGLRSQTQSLRSQASMIDEETAGVQTLYEQGYAPKTRVLALERNAAGLEGSIGQTSAQIGQATTMIGEKRSQAADLEARSRQESSERLATVVAETVQLAEKMAQQKAVLDRTLLKSPVNGVVLNRFISTIGGVAKPGDPVMEVVPTEDLQVVSNVRPQDIETVHVGQDAKVRFTSLNVQTTPQLTGKVTYVSADALADPQSGARFYRVRVSVPRSERQKLKAISLTPGMPIEVLMDGGKRTMMQYLLQPVTNAFGTAFRES